MRDRGNARGLHCLPDPSWAPRGRPDPFPARCRHARACSVSGTGLSAPAAPPPPGAGLPTPPYQELAQLLAQPEVGLIHQYCQGYWRHVPPSPREDPGAPRPPEPQDQKKPRNCRHHPPDT